VRTLLAYKRGEPRVCSMVRPPSPEEEDRRRLPPGESEVISQVDRLSSNETKIAPRSVRMALWSCGWWSCIMRAPASGWYSDITPLVAERSATPPHGIFSFDAAPARGCGLGLRPWRTSERLPPSFGLGKDRPELARHLAPVLGFRGRARRPARQIRAARGRAAAGARRRAGRRVGRAAAAREADRSHEIAKNACYLVSEH
jgi:hypothetical protein